MLFLQSVATHYPSAGATEPAVTASKASRMRRATKNKCPRAGRWDKRKLAFPSSFVLWRGTNMCRRAQSDARSQWVRRSASVVP